MWLYGQFLQSLVHLEKWEKSPAGSHRTASFSAWHCWPDNFSVCCTISAILPTGQASDRVRDPAPTGNEPSSQSCTLMCSSSFEYKEGDHETHKSCSKEIILFTRSEHRAAQWVEQCLSLDYSRNRLKVLLWALRMDIECLSSPPRQGYLTEPICWSSH